jgi:hypothetical protein
MDFHESVMLNHAKQVIPVFTKGMDQLDPINVEKTRGIAKVHIDVESSTMEVHYP